jgi:hypothetical protein
MYAQTHVRETDVWWNLWVKLTSFKTYLTLIGPGEVKVDLANFDLKLQENLLSTLYIIF